MASFTSPSGEWMRMRFPSLIAKGALNENPSNVTRVILPKKMPVAGLSEIAFCRLLPAK